MPEGQPNTDGMTDNKNKNKFLRIYSNKGQFHVTVNTRVNFFKFIVGPLYGRGCEAK